MAHQGCHINVGHPGCNFNQNLNVVLGQSELCNLIPLFIQISKHDSIN